MNHPQTIDYQKYQSIFQKKTQLKVIGRVSQVVGLTVEVQGIEASLGEICEVSTQNQKTLPLEVVGFRDKTVITMPLGDLFGIGAGSQVVATGQRFSLQVGMSMLGRVVDGLGRPLDKKELVMGEAWAGEQEPINPLERLRIERVFSTGIRAIDSLITCGEGQRLGIFAGSGVGKSTLLGMIARQSEADVNVIGLIGERGREVGDFLSQDLGEEGLKNSVVIAATSDQPALIRIKGALAATSCAEYFRRQGKKVLLLMDSVTRLAMAQREVGLAIGEPPTTKGYTPSVFALLPKLLERPGHTQEGSITAFYTVLVEGDDFNEPVTDTVRSILDGHLVLSRELAAKNHFPALDVLASNSRLMMDITTQKQQSLAGRVKRLLSVYKEAEDLINIGAYVEGSDPKIDEAKEYVDRIHDFLQQDAHEAIDFAQAQQQLKELFANEKA